MGHGASRTRSIQANTVEEYDENDTPKITLITGCSSGIGLAVAALLANDPKKRFRVYATMRNLGKKEAMEEAVKDVLGDVLFINELDVCSEESVSSAVNEIIEKEGRLDVLVNNAGIGLFCVAECADDDKVKSMFNTNVFGMMRVTKSVVPHMKKHQSGHIVNMSSVYGLMGLPFGEIFSATMFAVEGFTESFAPVLKQFNIKSTIIELGPVATNFAVNAKVMRESIDISTADEQTKSLLKTCLPVYGKQFALTSQTPHEIAQVVKKVLLLKNPHLRYQPNPIYRKQELAAKLAADSTGDKITELLTRHSFPEPQASSSQ